MSGFGDIFDFQKFLGKDIWKKWKEDPERALLGINTPLETGIWGKITGKDYEPTVDMYGGNTKNQASNAAASGINTGPGEKAHDIARAITSMFAGGYGLSLLGGAGAGAGTGEVVGGSAMPAAVAESPGTLSGYGMTQTAPGVWSQSAAGTGGAPAWARARGIPQPQPYKPPPQRQGASPMADPYGLNASGVSPDVLTPQEEQRLKVLSALIKRGGMNG